MKIHVQVIKAMTTPASSLMRRLPSLAATVIVLKPTIVDAQLDGAVRAILLARTASEWGLPSHGAGRQSIKAGVCQQPYRNKPPNTKTENRGNAVQLQMKTGTA